MIEPRITRMGADRNESIMLDKMVHEELSGEIIGAAMSVLNALKPVALLLNFKYARLKWKWIVRTIQ